MEMRSSLSSGMGEASMYVGSGPQEILRDKTAEDGEPHQPQGGVPDAPQRGDISSVEQVLRGKIPGIPG
jgi:hypothetical protein